MIFKNFVHYGFHFIFPLGIAFLFFRKKWIQVYLIFIGTMVIDLDHLFTTPIFEPNRCSINFHPMHSSFAIGIYLVMLIPKKTRVLAIGLLIHMIADTLDCLI